MKAKEYINGFVAVFCPGCNCIHAMNIHRDGEPKWEFNNDFESPTFSPSVLVRTGKYVDPDFQDEDGLSSICHSFIKNGSIQFLTDSTHHLSGKTVPLPETDNWNYQF